MNLKPTPEMPE